MIQANVLKGGKPFFNREYEGGGIRFLESTLNEDSRHLIYLGSSRRIYWFSKHDKMVNFDQKPGILGGKNEHFSLFSGVRTILDYDSTSPPWSPPP